MDHKAKNKINEVCYQKIERLKELSKKEPGRQFLHHSTLSGYTGGVHPRISPSNRLKDIAERGLISSRQLNRELGKARDYMDQEHIDLLPDYQPLFEISGHAKAIYIVDPAFLSEERQRSVYKDGQRWANGTWNKGGPFGLDLCEYFEISSNKSISADYILGLILRPGRTNALIDNVLKYQGIAGDEKAKMIKELPGNYTFLSVFEEKPENSFPIFSGGVESKVIDPQGRVNYEGHFINLEKMLPSQIFPKV